MVRLFLRGFVWAFFRFRPLGFRPRSSPSFHKGLEQSSTFYGSFGFTWRFNKGSIRGLRG